MPSVNVDSTPSVVENTASPGFQLGPEFKLKLKSEFDAVKDSGRRVTTQYFIALVSGQQFGASLKCGIICSRKFDKRAVKRNRARRLMWEAFRMIKGKISPCGIVLIPRREILNVKMQDVKLAFEWALKKAGVMIKL